MNVILAETGRAERERLTALDVLYSDLEAIEMRLRLHRATRTAVRLLVAIRCEIARLGGVVSVPEGWQ